MRALKAKGRREMYLPTPNDVSKALQVNPYLTLYPCYHMLYVPLIVRGILLL